MREVGKLNKLLEIDYLRSFAIISVILIHTTALATQNVADINTLVISNEIVRLANFYAVPLFVFISGFVLYYKYRDSFSKKKFYANRAKSILPSYILFSLIYQFKSTIQSYVYGGELQVPSIYDVTLKLLTTSSHGNFWFIGLIIQMYMIYPPLAKIYNNMSEKNKTSLFMVSIIGIQYIWNIIKPFTNIYFNTLYPLIYALFLSHIFYFVLGMYVCEHYPQMKKRIIESQKIIIILLIITLLCTTYLRIQNLVQYGNYIDGPKYYRLIPYSLSIVYNVCAFSTIFYISIKFSNKSGSTTKIISEIGKYSYSIYLVHGLFVDIISTSMCKYINYNQWMFYPIHFIAVISLSYISTYFMSHLPYGNLLTGIKK